MADREVTIGMRVEAGQASKAMDDIARQAGKVSAATADAQKGVDRLTRGGPAAAGGAAGDGGAAVAGLAKSAAILAAAEAVGRAVDASGRALQTQVTLNDSLATSWGKVSLEVGRSIPVVGGFISGVKELVHSLSGRAEQQKADAAYLNTLQQSLASSAARRAVAGPLAEQAAAGRAGVGDAGILAAAAGNRAALVGGFAFSPDAATAGLDAARLGVLRATSASAAADQVAQGRLAEEAAARAGLAGLGDRERQARLSLAAGESALAKGELALSAGPSAGNRLRFDDRQGFYRERGAATPDVSAEEVGRRSVNVATQLAILKDTLAQKQMQANALAAAEGRSKEALVAAEQKRLDIARAQADVTRAQLDLVKGEEDRVRSSATQFGLMDVTQQQALVDAAQRLKGGGLGSLSPEQVALLQGSGLTSPGLATAAEGAAQSNPLFQQLLAITGNRDLKTIITDKVKLQQEVSVKVEVDEERLQAAMKRILEEYFRKADVSVKAGFEASRQAQDIDRQVQRLQQK